MPVCGRDHDWIDDSGEKEKMASYGCRSCFRIQLYPDHGKIYKDMHGTAVRPLKGFEPEKALIHGITGYISILVRQIADIAFFY